MHLRGLPAVDRTEVAGVDRNLDPDRAVARNFEERRRAGNFLTSSDGDLLDDSVFGRRDRYRSIGFERRANHASQSLLSCLERRLGEPELFAGFFYLSDAASLVAKKLFGSVNFLLRGIRTRLCIGQLFFGKRACIALGCKQR